MGSAGEAASIPWKTIGIAVKAGSAGVAPLVRHVAERVAAHATDLLLDPEAAPSVPGSSAYPLEQIAAQADLMIVLGGDGTVLQTARAIGERDVPILGINLGRLGLLADVNPDEVDAALAAAFAGEYLIESRTRLAVTRLEGDPPRRPALVLNDAVVTGALDLARLVDLETRVNQSPMGAFRADGLIVCTPTGSTAYNLAAGGPILDPALPAMVLTPISPQAAFPQRPIVLSAECVVEVWIHFKQSGNVTLDGQVGFRLEGGQGIRVTRSHHPSRFLRLRGYDYFATLRSKLQWGSQ